MRKGSSKLKIILPVFHLDPVILFFLGDQVFLLFLLRQVHQVILGDLGLLVLHPVLHLLVRLVCHCFLEILVILEHQEFLVRPKVSVEVKE